MNVPILLHLFYFFFLLVFRRDEVAAAVTDDSSLPYRPPDNIAIDCGSSGNTTAADHRPWEGDINNKFFPRQGQNDVSLTLEAIHPPSNPVPYQTVRLSRSEFSYRIPVTPGQKFLRLHFYPDVFGAYDASKAFFSVKAANFTLLSNFSAFLNDRAPDDGHGIVKEFCLDVDKEVFLTVTFTPDVSSNNSESFAFVNGIEVVSMPTNIYYSSTDVTSQPKFVGQDSMHFAIRNDTALATMYRINVGGSDISPADDTGVFRNWEADNDYLTQQGYSVLPVEFKHNLSFRFIKPYTAPAPVYKTARSLGNKDRDTIRSSNVTWEFPVDSSFNYLVRLHFCEVEDNIKTNERVFVIHIANQLAEEDADVMRWTNGERYAPVYKDYVVSFSLYGQTAQDKKRVNLSIVLQPDLLNWMRVFVDGIVNGVEIFKLNDTVGDLAGPNPEAPISPPPPVALPGGNHKGGGRSRAVVGVVFGVVSGVVLLSLPLGFFVFRRARKVKSRKSVDGKSWRGSVSLTTTKSTNARDSSSLPSDLCRYFSLAETKAATNNFDDVFIVGRGGFGNVYKGYIDNGTTTVAVKRLKPESSQGAHEYKTEIEMLSELRHPHLVSLIGYCNDFGEMILVYEYMARGTLQEHLYNSENPPLSWKQRLEICIGAARGLLYLHTGAKHAIIHRDVKTTNILLGENWKAKMSDFGLSRTGPTSMSKSHVTTVVKGSMGYLDPEYYKRQQLTKKSDVYSFGVVLCEVLCARPPLLRAAEKGQMSLVGEIVDEHLKGKIAAECLRKFGEIAVSCIADDRRERPTMEEVVWGLEFALQLQQGAEENEGLIGALGGETEGEGEDHVSCLLTRESSSQDDQKFSCSRKHSSKRLKGSGDTKASSSEQ